MVIKICIDCEPIVAYIIAASIAVIAAASIVSHIKHIFSHNEGF